MTNINGMHKHQCVNCGSVWEHPKPDDTIDNKKAHECPKCGKEEYWHANPKLHVDFPFIGWHGMENTCAKAKDDAKSFIHKAHIACHKNKKHLLAVSTLTVGIVHFFVPELEIWASIAIGYVTVEFA